MNARVNLCDTLNSIHAGHCHSPVTCAHGLLLGVEEMQYLCFLIIQHHWVLHRVALAQGHGLGHTPRLGIIEALGRDVDPHPAVALRLPREPGCDVPARCFHYKGGMAGFTCGQQERPCC